MFNTKSAVKPKFRSLVWQLLSSGEKLLKGQPKILIVQAKVTDMKNGNTTNRLSSKKSVQPAPVQIVLNQFSSNCQFTCRIIHMQYYGWFW